MRPIRATRRIRILFPAPRTNQRSEPGYNDVRLTLRFPRSPNLTFDHHAFISYAIIDNKPLSPEQEGWVTRFHATFEALLSMRIGESARIWRDAKLQGNDALSGEIFDRIGRTALLVTVLTPRYLESDWCTRELVEFCSRVDRSGGVAPQNKSRVLKVLKTPVPLESVPESIRDTLGYAF